MSKSLPRFLNKYSMSFNLLGGLPRPFASLCRSAISVAARSSSTSSGARVNPRVFPTTGFATVPASEKLEEENWKWYTPEYFYPVNIGEVLCSRYQVLYKLGFGTTSTVWMCRDLDQNKYVCVKSICQNHPSFDREVKADESLSKASAADPVDSRRSPIQSVRQLLDHFQLRRSNMNYSFLVQEPLGISMTTLLQFGGRLPIDAVHAFAINFLRTLEFVHAGGVVHADIHPGNIFSRIQDETLFRELEEDEIANPSPRKITDSATIFASKEINYGGALRRWFGPNSDLVLCDFGEARQGQRYYCETVLPPHVRPPEVFMRIPWDEAVDIWSFGCMLWQLATGEPLFPRTREEYELESADYTQLASMVALLGPLPERLLKLYRMVLPDIPAYFNEDGSPAVQVPDQTLESRLASALEGSMFPIPPKQQEEFLAFMRRVLVWEFYNRLSAPTLRKDPWILGEVGRYY